MRWMLWSVLVLGACGGTEAPPPQVKVAKAAKGKKSKGKKAKGKAKAKADPAAKLTGNPEAGAKVYGQFCVPCHQADGTGLNGTIAGDFVHDKSRLAKPDAELLLSIRDGKTGKIGTMPPWGPSLSDQERADALAYVRKQFGDK